MRFRLRTLFLWMAAVAVVWAACVRWPVLDDETFPTVPFKRPPNSAESATRAGICFGLLVPAYAIGYLATRQFRQRRAAKLPRKKRPRRPFGQFS